MGLEPLVRPLLIAPHQARVPRHIGGEDRGEAADRGHIAPGSRVGLTKSTLKPAGPSAPIRPATSSGSRLRRVRGWRSRPAEESLPNTSPPSTRARARARAAG